MPSGAPGFFLALAPALVVHHLQRLVEHRLVVAAVVDVAGRDLVGELVGPDEVLAANLRRVHSEFLGRGIDHALQHEVGDLGAEPPVRALLALVGQHRGQGDLSAPDPVGAGELGRRVAVVAHPELEIGAVVVDHLHPEARDGAVVHDRDLHVVDAVRPVVVAARDVVDAVLEVLDRPPGGAGEGRGEHRSLVREQLAAEAAAGDHRHDVEPVGGYAEGDRHQPAHVVVHGDVGVDGELAHALVVLGDGADRLHRLTTRTRPPHLSPEHPVRGGEVALDVAEAEGALQRDVVRPALGMKHRVAARRDGVLGVDHRGQQLVLHVDEVDGVLGDVAALRHHRGHGLAHVADPIRGDAVLGDRRVGEAGQRSGLLGGLGAGHHQHHARQRFGPAGVDALDARVRVRASQHRGVGHVGKDHVVDVLAAPGQQPRVLDALHALADPAVAAPGLGGVGVGGFAHCPSPRILAAAVSTASTMVW